MTQLSVGVMQEFPRGSSLKLSSQSELLLAESELYQYEETRAEIIRSIRLNWIELYYLLEARKILESTKIVFANLVEVSLSKLSSGAGFQHDVLRSQIELTQIESRLIQNQEEIDKVRAILTRFLGGKIARAVEPRSLPNWPDLITESAVLEKIKSHPSILKRDMLIKSTKKKLDASKELYKPAWSVGVKYSVREGKSGISRKKRSDFIGVHVSTELPFFTAKRQDKTIAASSKKYQIAKSQRSIDYLNLSLEVAQFYALFRQLSQQELLYEKELLSDIQQYKESTLSAYKNAQVAFDIVSKAYDNELTASLQFLRIKTQKMKAHAQLLYLEGKAL